MHRSPGSGVISPVSLQQPGFSGQSGSSRDTEHIMLVEHCKIYEFIIRHDPDAAAYAMMEHLNRSREIFRSRIRSA